MTVIDTCSFNEVFYDFHRNRFVTKEATAASGIHALVEFHCPFLHCLLRVDGRVVGNVGKFLIIGEEVVSIITYILILNCILGRRRESLNFLREGHRLLAFEIHHSVLAAQVLPYLMSHYHCRYCCSNRPVPIQQWRCVGQIHSGSVSMGVG